MRHKIVTTSNVRALMAAEAAAETRDPGLPGILLVHGEAGAGKTSTIAHLAVKLGAVYLTALPFWKTHAMLSAICSELSMKPLSRCAPMFDLIARELTIRPRPIFLDEADAIVDHKELVETLRILHDITSVPLVLIGMSEFRSKVMRRPQIERRVLREVEFRPSTLADARLMAAELAEVGIADDLVEVMHRRSRGSAGLFVNEQARAEGFCRRRGLKQIAAADYDETITSKPANLAAAA
jgi:DNA transposition AAA+ family ATPase